MKRKFIHGYLILLAALLLAAACHKTPEAPEEPGTEICLSVSTAQPVETRITTIDNDVELSINFVRVDAFFHGTTTSLFSNAQLRYRAYTDRWEFYSTSASDWAHFYWPIEGSVYEPVGTVNSLDFVGYVPYTPPGEISLNDYSASNGPSFSAVLPYTSGTPNTFTETDQAPIREFMYAYVPDQTKDTNSGTVNLEFQHPFALVNIYLKSAKRGTVINSVHLGGIKTSGTFVQHTGWGSLGTEATLSKTVGKTVPGQLNFDSLIGGPYMVIPQTLSGSNNLTVNQTYNASTGDISGTINTTWEPGHIYSYYLDLGADSGRILVDVVVEAWQAHTVPTIDVK